MFQDGLEEFDSAREIVDQLRQEYVACEKSDYVNYGSQNTELEVVLTIVLSSMID